MSFLPANSSIPQRSIRFIITLGTRIVNPVVRDICTCNQNNHAHIFVHGSKYSGERTTRCHDSYFLFRNRSVSCNRKIGLRRSFAVGSGCWQCVCPFPTWYGYRCARIEEWMRRFRHFSSLCVSFYARAIGLAEQRGREGVRIRANIDPSWISGHFFLLWLCSWRIWHIQHNNPLVAVASLKLSQFIIQLGRFQAWGRKRHVEENVHGSFVTCWTVVVVKWLHRIGSLL